MSRVRLNSLLERKEQRLESDVSSQADHDSLIQVEPSLQNHEKARRSSLVEQLCSSSYSFTEESKQSREDITYATIIHLVIQRAQEKHTSFPEVVVRNFAEFTYQNSVQVVKANPSVSSISSKRLKSLGQKIELLQPQNKLIRQRTQFESQPDGELELPQLKTEIPTPMNNFSEYQLHLMKFNYTYNVWERVSSLITDLSALNQELSLYLATMESIKRQDLSI